MGFTGGDAGVMRIEDMGYFDPDIITFGSIRESRGRTLNCNSEIGSR